MSILGTTASQAAHTIHWQHQRQAGSNLFQQLGASLKRGDLSGARQAFAAINQQIQQARQQGSGSQSAGGSAAALSGRNDFAALTQALKSGNLGSAQQAFSSLTQDLSAYAKQDQGGGTPVSASTAHNRGDGLNGGSLHLMA